MGSIVPHGRSRLTITGMKVKQADIRELEGLKVEIRGEIRIKTNAQVVSHNAASTPSFFGLLGSYSWRVAKPTDPLPEMELALAGDGRRSL